MVDVAPDENFTILWVSENYLRFFHLDYKKFVRGGWFDVIPTEHLDLVKTRLRRVADEKITVMGSNYCLKKGRKQLVRWMNTPILDDHGEVIQINCRGRVHKDHRTKTR